MASASASSQCSSDAGISYKCQEAWPQSQISGNASIASQYSDEDISNTCHEPLLQTLSKAAVATENSPETRCAPARKNKGAAKRAAHLQKGDDEDFGFEFCRWAQQKLAGKHVERQDLLEALAGQVVTLAFHPWGFRVIQYALDAGDDESHVLLADELRGHALAACFSMHANFVILKIVEVAPLARLQWIFEELRDNSLQLARDKCGCRILSRLFSRPDAWEDPTSAAEGLIDDVLGSAGDLCYHPFGQHVVEAALVSGSDWHRSRVFAALQGKCAQMSKNRHGSYVVQRAFEVCSPAEREIMASEILGGHTTLMALCQNPFGHHVVRTALGMPGQLTAQAARRMAAEQGQLRESKFGSKLLGDIGL